MKYVIADATVYRIGDTLRDLRHLEVSRAVAVIVQHPIHDGEHLS